MAIIIENKGNYSSGNSNVNTFTQAITLSASCNKLIVKVRVSNYSVQYVSFNGVNLSSVGGFYYMDNPPVGASYNLVVKILNKYNALVLVSYYGISGAAEGIANSSSGNGTTSVNVTMNTKANSLIINGLDISFYGSASVAYSETLDCNIYASTYIRLYTAHKYTNTAGNNTTGYTMDNTSTNLYAIVLEEAKKDSFILVHRLAQSGGLM